MAGAWENAIVFAKTNSLVTNLFLTRPFKPIDSVSATVKLSFLLIKPISLTGLNLLRPAGRWNVRGKVEDLQ